MALISRAGAFGGYVKSQLILSAGVFAILSAGFFLMGQPYGLLLALGLSVLDFVPASPHRCPPGTGWGTARFGRLKSWARQTAGTGR